MNLLRILVARLPTVSTLPATLATVARWAVRRVGRRRLGTICRRRATGATSSLTAELEAACSPQVLMLRRTCLRSNKVLTGSG
jgi:hypothetical protein